MYLEFCTFVIIFCIYSFIGYFIEVISVSIKEDKLVFSRGYLIGPYLPIFGFGALTIIYYLEKYQNDLLTIFLLGLITCCGLEYVTSLIMEKIFHLRWWDYSDRKFNINGRVCLENGIYFGLGAILLVRYLHPFLTERIALLSNMTICILGSSILAIILIDFIWSTYIILQLKIDIDIYSKIDATKIVKSEIKKIIMRHSIFRKRIIDAYPAMKKNKNMKSIEEYIEKNKKTT